MTDAVETMAFAGTLPWHGLGTKIEDNLTPEQVLKAASLNWSVSKRPLLFAGTEADENFEDIVIGDRFALVRDSDNNFLDIVGKNYIPTQNKDSFEFFDKFVKETKLKMHTAGSLCGGKWVWALAETAQSFEIGPDKDRMESYILLVSPHQFGRSLIIQQTSVRVVCMNTLNLALNEAGMVSYRMPHTRTFDGSAKHAAAEVLGLVTETFKDFKDHVKSLSDKKVTRNEAIDFFSGLLKLKPESVNKDDGLPNSKLLRQFLDAFEGGAPGADLRGTKGRMWGVVNAVTYVMDHVSVRDQEKSLRDSWFGYRGELKRKGLALALEASTK